MNPKKRRWAAPAPGGAELNVTGKTGAPVYNPAFGPAKSRVIRGPGGKLVAIPIPPPGAAPSGAADVVEPLAGDKALRVYPTNGEPSLDGKTGLFYYASDMPPALLRIERDADGKLIAVPLAPLNMHPPTDPPADAPA